MRRIFHRKRISVIITMLFLIGILISLLSSVNASNSIPSSGMDHADITITIEQLRPYACGGMNLQTIITDGNGSSSNDLILGSTGNDNLTGNDGNDCLVAGNGDDTLDGGPGDDICIGGQGTNSFVNCETIIDP